MALSVVMPALEMAQDTGKLLAWRKKEGEHVVKGEPLVEIETDKAVVEIEAPGDGVLAGVTAQPGAVVPVGRTIAWLVQPGESVPIDQSPIAQSPINPQSAILNPQYKISPKARRLAQERGVDLATIKGSGPGGEILASDIEATIANRSAIPQSPIVHQSAILNPQSAIRMTTAARLMAERTTQSWTTVPHFFLTREVDATALVAARERSPGVSHTDLLVALVARALKKHPRMNGGAAPVNVAIAIAVDDAVVTGVIHRADAASLADIAARRQELTGRARAGRLQPADIAGATFTISNLGMYQVDAFTAIIVPPQAGILAVGAIADRVVAVDGAPAVRPMVTLTLSCDHRVVDGARGAAFLNDIVDATREPGGQLT